MMLLVSARESADRIAEHRSMIDAAAAAGVAKIVYISFQGAAPDATFTFARDHFHTEQLIVGSGLRHVFLRDSLYQRGCRDRRGRRHHPRPGGDGSVAAVGHDDVAAVAARVLTDDRWDEKTLDVTGPAALTLTEVAAELTAVSGLPVRYELESEEQAYASRAHYDAPPFEVKGWVTSYQAIAPARWRPSRTRWSSSLVRGSELRGFSAALIPSVVPPHPRRIVVAGSRSSVSGAGWTTRSPDSPHRSR